MGGGTLKHEEESSRSSSSSPCSYCFSYGLNDVVSEDNFSNHATDLRRREKSYQEILQSYELLQKNSKRKLKLARNQIFSYTPGSWADVNLSDYNVPKTTSILIVGPKGAGKSSLVNKIAKVIENDEFAPARAQESYGTSDEGGTFFVQEYMIPKGSSASFCLYDTRGFSQSSSSDNTSKIEQWITSGVHHGEPVIWTSDSSDLRDRLIRDGSTGCEIRKVNSVIFVVNAVEIFKSMESGSSYAYMISTAFNSPLLSFKDDKPAVVMAHGDVLSLEERARVRVFVGELLGIPPNKQIFDVPESRDTATALTICNLLRHSLEHADKNLQFLAKRNFNISKVRGGITKGMSLVKMMMSIIMPLLVYLVIIYSLHTSVGHQNLASEALHKLHRSPRLDNLTQPKPRWVNHAPVPNHESVPEGDPSIDLYTRRRLWFHEQVETEAESSSDWQSTRRRLWYVE